MRHDRASSIYQFFSHPFSPFRSNAKQESKESSHKFVCKLRLIVVRHLHLLSLLRYLSLRVCPSVAPKNHRRHHPSRPSLQ